MADIRIQFEQAREDAKSLAEKPDNMTLLRIYALYKQGSQGDVTGDRPGVTDFIGRAKWDAWHALMGRPKEQAMQEYIDLVESLK